MYGQNDMPYMVGEDSVPDMIRFKNLSRYPRSKKGTAPAVDAQVAGAINVNDASAKTIQEGLNITLAEARKIFQNRPYQTVEDLHAVNGRTNWPDLEKQGLISFGG